MPGARPVSDYRPDGGPEEGSMNARMDLKQETITRVSSVTQKCNRRVLGVIVLSSLSAVAPLIAADDARNRHAAHAHGGKAEAAPAKLVQLVRDATKQFVDVNAATAAGYQPFLGCVSGPDHGAMGFHYVNSDLVGDGEIDVSRPEALIYEATDGSLQLLGVEFVVLADTWMAKHSSPPVLEGQTFQYVSS